MIIDSKAGTSGGDSEPITPLNPGPSPRRRSKVTCKCTLWTLLVVSVLAGGYFGSKVAYMAYNRAKEPHPSLYQDLSVPYRPQDVVRPLIDSNQTFDIVATVWLRTEPEPLVNTKDTREGEAEEKKSASEDEEGLEREKEKVDPVNKDDESELVEKAIWTDTVFRGLRLKDKNKTAVKFQVPTAIFKKRELNTYDLRASFVLIPNAPSPLDHVSNYSTWIPDPIRYPPSRSWPDGYSRSLAEEVVDAYGTFVPLLSFYTVKSRCGSVDNSTTTVLANLGDDDDDEEQEEDPLLDLVVPSSKQDRFSKKGQPPLQSHPYIITRSFLRVVDMTKLYNRRGYDKAHKKLRMLSCGEPLQLLNMKAVKPDWRTCTRSFVSHGNQEVRIKLTKQNENTGKDLTEWAYAPYLTVADAAWGPTDLVPAPVNREECRNKDSTGDQHIPDEDFVNITWNIAFSGRTPEKLLMADAFSLSTNFNMTDTESNHLATHSTFELLQGMAGHHFRDDYHPRRAMFLHVVGFFMALLDLTFELHYWYSRASTVGIAVTGNALIAGGGLLDFVFHSISESSDGDYSIVKFMWALIYNSVFQLFSLLMLKAVTRAEFHLSKHWIPILRFAPASHAERSSQRLESYPSKRSKILAFMILGCFFTICYSQNYYVINPRGITDPRSRVSEAVVTLQNVTVLPAMTLGRILQIIMNSRSRKFAGTYKIATALGLVSSLIAMAGLAPWIIGEAMNNHGMTVFSFGELLFTATMAYQALKYPSLSQVDEDEDTK